MAFTSSTLPFLYTMWSWPETSIATLYWNLLDNISKILINQNFNRFFRGDDIGEYSNNYIRLKGSLYGTTKDKIWKMHACAICKEEWPQMHSPQWRWISLSHSNKKLHALVPLVACCYMHCRHAPICISLTSPATKLYKRERQPLESQFSFGQAFCIFRSPEKLIISGMEL